MLSSSFIEPRGQATSPSRIPSAESLRVRNKKKDDAIRKRAEQGLKRKPSFKNGDSSFHSTSPTRVKPGSVASLRPLSAVIVTEGVYISQIAQLMAAKKTDSVLVVDRQGHLSGILTDKDICYRVVSQGLDPRGIVISKVMTPNPTFVYESDDRNDALSIMSERKFRHLPVLSKDSFVDHLEIDIPLQTNVVALLDITKCVFERLGDLEAKVSEDTHIIHAMETLEKHGTIHKDFAHSVRGRHGCPDLADVLQQISLSNSSNPAIHSSFPVCTFKSTVRDAAICMLECHSTGVLILDSEDRLSGIFTTKDIVLRVIATGLDPNTTTVVRVMTHNPDSVESSTSILDALKRMKECHYLHLPVVEKEHTVGLLDVQQLTMSMLSYLMSKSTTTNENGPMWSNFWSSTLAAEKNDSILEVPIPSTPIQLVFNSSTHSELDVSEIQNSHSISIKIKDSIHGRVFRVTHRLENAHTLLDVLKEKLGVTDFESKLFYHDDEKDFVNISQDSDVYEALDMCSRLKWQRLVLYFGSVSETMIEDEPEEVLEIQKPVVNDKHWNLATKICLTAGLLGVTAFVMNRILK